MLKKNVIPLFYWSEVKFIFKEKENYGDLLSKYLVEKISGKKVVWVHPRKQSWYKRNKKNYLAIGSIIHHATKKSIVWGSGIIDQKQRIAEADFRAVRGPRTREFLLNLGYLCPPVYGDPAILLPMYYNPVVKKKFKIGIIPHYHDFTAVSAHYKDRKDVLVVNLMTLDIEEVTRKILSCEKTISSSLHGLIVSHAYNIPSIWVQFSNKIFGDGIKYRDYLESMGIKYYNAPFIQAQASPEMLEGFFEEKAGLPYKEKMKELQEGLLAACPF